MFLLKVYTPLFYLAQSFNSLLSNCLLVSHLFRLPFRYIHFPFTCPLYSFRSSFVFHFMLLYTSKSYLFFFYKTMFLYPSIPMFIFLNSFSIPLFLIISHSSLPSNSYLSLCLFHLRGLHFPIPPTRVCSFTFYPILLSPLLLPILVYLLTHYSACSFSSFSLTTNPPYHTQDAYSMQGFLS